MNMREAASVFVRWACVFGAAMVSEQSEDERQKQRSAADHGGVGQRPPSKHLAKPLWSLPFEEVSLIGVQGLELAGHQNRNRQPHGHFGGRDGDHEKDD